jgi:hypothetical protein
MAGQRDALVSPRNLEREGLRFLPHGAAVLPGIHVDAYSVELTEADGFTGDRASKGAFTRILEEVRQSARAAGEDPLGSKPSEEISRKKLDSLLVEGDAREGAVVQSAVEDFAQELKSVIARFLELKAWRDTECIVIGGGLRDSRIGEVAIERAGILLNADDHAIRVQSLKGDPDEAALIGAAHLLPVWMLEGYDAMVAADIGGTNFRTGLVELNLRKAKDLSKAEVANFERWCHAEKKDVKRDTAVERLVEMLAAQIQKAGKLDLRLAPVIGIGCPGVIRADGTIERGTQNLPGQWASSSFNLPAEIRERIGRIGEHDVAVVLHNDAVVQGLSQLPRMRKWQRWGIFTIGTGLGNAHFSAREDASD